MSTGLTETQLRYLNIFLFSILIGAFFKYPMIIILLSVASLVLRNKKILAALNLGVALLGLTPVLGKLLEDSVISRLKFLPLSIGTLLLAALYFRFTLHWSRIKCGVVFLSSSILFAGVAVSYFPILQQLVFFLFAFIWGMLAWSRSLKDPKEINWVNLGIAIQPFCSQNPAPILDSWSETSLASQSGRDLQWRNLKLIFITVGVIIFREFFVEFSKGNALARLTLFYDMGQGSGLKLFSASQLSTGEWWAVCVGNFIYSSSRLYSSVIPGVLFLRIWGWDLKSPVYNLLRARSLYEFFENLNHYYNRIIVDQFVIPLMHLFSKFRPPRVRLYLSFFCGIIFCGFLYHATKRPVLTFQLGLLDNVYWVLQGTVYWVFLATAVIFSFVIERKRRTENPRVAVIVLKNILYLLISSALLVFVREFELKQMGFLEHWHLFMKLWTFN